MASTNEQLDISIIRSPLNEATPRSEEAEKIIRALHKAKFYRDRESMRFLIEKGKKNLSKMEELEKEYEENSEAKQQDG